MGAGLVRARGLGPMGPRGAQGQLGQGQLGGSRAVAAGGTSTSSHRGAGPNENTISIKKAEIIMENLDENDKEHIKKHPSKPRRLH